MVARYTPVSEAVYLLETDTGANQLNGLTDGSHTRVTNTEDVQVSNDQFDERHIFGDFFISIATQEGPRREGAFLALYLVPIITSAIGLRTEPSAEVPEMLNNYYVGSFAMDSTQLPRHGVIGAVRLPPVDFFPVIQNESGQRLANTGNILTVYTYGYEDSL